MRPGVRWSVCENLQEIEAELQISAHRLWWAVLASSDTYTWWSVVVIICQPRWSCVRRISTGEFVSVEQLAPPPRG